MCLTSRQSYGAVSCGKETENLPMIRAFPQSLQLSLLWISKGCQFDLWRLHKVCCTDFAICWATRSRYQMFVLCSSLYSKFPNCYSSSRPDFKPVDIRLTHCRVFPRRCQNLVICQPSCPYAILHYSALQLQFSCSFVTANDGENMRKHVLALHEQHVTLASALCAR